MTGISSHALGKLDNKRGYNGNEIQDKEFSDGSGLELYDFNARTYDQQIGRFMQIDPLLEDGQESFNPYHFSYNNPIRFSDPDGKMADGCCGFSGFVDAVNDVTRAVAVGAGAAANAWASNQIGGAGRVDVNQQGGLTDSDKTAAVVGQAIGDAVSIVTGAIEVTASGAAALVTGGTATPAAVVVAAHGASSVALGATNLIKGAANGGKSNSNSNSSSSSSSSAPKQSKVEKSTKTENVGGKYTKTTEVRPGKGPGQSRAEYTRYKNQDGKTIRSHKDSYDRGNKFQGRKSTTGDPEKRRTN